MLEVTYADLADQQRRRGSKSNPGRLPVTGYRSVMEAVSPGRRRRTLISLPPNTKDSILIAHVGGKSSTCFTSPKNDVMCSEFIRCAYLFTRLLAAVLYISFRPTDGWLLLCYCMMKCPLLMCLSFILFPYTFVCYFDLICGKQSVACFMLISTITVNIINILETVAAFSILQIKLKI